MALNAQDDDRLGNEAVAYTEDDREGNPDNEQIPNYPDNDDYSAAAPDQQDFKQQDISLTDGVAIGSLVVAGVGVLCSTAYSAITTAASLASLELLTASVVSAAPVVAPVVAVGGLSYAAVKSAPAVKRATGPFLSKKIKRAYEAVDFLREQNAAAQNAARAKDSSESRNYAASSSHGRRKWHHLSKKELRDWSLGCLENDNMFIGILTLESFELDDDEADEEGGDGFEMETFGEQRRAVEPTAVNTVPVASG